MGIQGLLVFVKQAYAQKARIQDFKGKKVGVDAMCWMHKGAFSCAQELVLEQDTDKFIYFFVRMCELLRCNGVHPVIVFDGARLPAKQREEQDRYENRERARTEAVELDKRRKAGERIDERLFASRCETAIRIKPSMISRLMGALRELGIHYIVAPYEADAQLAFMCRKGQIAAVITEDSDLLAYGCPSTIFKMDKDGEIGQHIMLPCLQARPKGWKPLCDEDEEVAEKENIDSNQGRQGETGAKRGRGKGRGRGRGGKKQAANGAGEAVVIDADEDDKEQPAFAANHADKEAGAGAKKDKAAEKVAVVRRALENWTPERFAEFCVLCGTDYREPDVHIDHLGPATACKLMLEHKGVRKMVLWMENDDKWKQHLPKMDVVEDGVPIKRPCSAQEYFKRFECVVAAFWHHIVYDSSIGKCVPIAEAFPRTIELRDLPGVDLPSICGTASEGMEARRMADGTVDPRTREIRDHEPLTRAERAYLDRIVKQKQQDQKEHNLLNQMHEDNARIAAHREAAVSLAATMTDQPSQKAPEDSRHHSEVPIEPVPTMEMDQSEDAEVRPPMSMTLLPGDIHVLQTLSLRQMPSERIRANEAEGNLETPPRPGGRLAMAGPTPSQAVVNPFARKRATPEALSQVTVLPKRQRLITEAPAEDASQASTAPKAEMKSNSWNQHLISVPGVAILKKTEAHPRGGYAYKDAAEAVLLQRGAPLLEAVPESQDRGKISFFCKSKQPAERKEEEKVSQPTSSKHSHLADWKARPWEVEEEGPGPFAIGINELSLQAQRSVGAKPWRKLT